MRITEKKLRKLINETMNEMNHEIVDVQVMRDSDHLSLDDSMMQKAKACMGMDAQKLFMMCVMICSQNPSMAEFCKRLCKCICDGDIVGCCECLSQICECPDCLSICSVCCKC